MEVLPLINQIRQSAEIDGFVVESLTTIKEFPILALSKIHDPQLPYVYISSGIHGDEPASPLALLQLLKTGVFDNRYNWLICPLLNPTGLRDRTRENEQGVDLNRDFRPTISKEISACIHWLESQPLPSLSLSLHEDYEGDGFYLYAMAGEFTINIGRKILDTIEASYKIDKAEIVDGHEADNGLIAPHEIREATQMPQWPEAVYLYERHPHSTFVFESPTAFPLNQRIEILCLATKSGLLEFHESSSK